MSCETIKNHAAFIWSVNDLLQRNYRWDVWFRSLDTSCCTMVVPVLELNEAGS
jgi:hypothetical protein